MSDEELQEYKTRVRDLLRATNEANRIEYNRSNLAQYERFVEEIRRHRR